MTDLMCKMICRSPPQADFNMKPIDLISVINFYSDPSKIVLTHTLQIVLNQTQVDWYPLKINITVLLRATH